MGSWISTFLFYATVLVILTGMVLYIMPPGRVAYWTDWRLQGLDKDQWEAIHILFGLLMMFPAVWHLYFNWKPFRRYLGSLRAPGKAFVSVTLATLILASLAVKDLPPASWLMALGARLKASWGNPSGLQPLLRDAGDDPKLTPKLVRRSLKTTEYSPTGRFLFGNWPLPMGQLLAK